MSNPAMQSFKRAGSPATPAAQTLAFPNPFLGLLPKWAWGKAKDWFTYGVAFVNAQALAASGSEGLTLVINDDAAFLVVSATAMVTTADDPTNFIAQWPILCNLTVSGAGRNLSDQPVALNSYFGTGEEPKYWEMVKALPRSTQLLVTLNNLDPNNEYAVRLYFHGFKVFDFSANGD